MLKIEIGGKERSFSFGLFAIGYILKEFENDVTAYIDALARNGFMAAPITLYCLHKSAVEQEGKVVDFTKYDVAKWIEDLEGNFKNEKVQTILNGVIDSLRDYLNQSNDEPSKKK